jgi:hypothetical protein
MCKKAGILFDLVFTEHAGHAREIARELALGIVVFSRINFPSSAIPTYT